MKQIFLNFSNHPSSLWSVKQLQAAQLYGEVIDMPFPDVLPTTTHTDIQQLALQVVENMFGLLSAKRVTINVDNEVSKNLTIHIMGEMTLTYAIVSLLKAKNIRCVASTTERISTLNPDGTKTSIFQFVQFREY